jgi:rhomboid family GlyGly-CTERM serine protease
MTMKAPRSAVTRFLTSVNGDGRYGLGLVLAPCLLLGTGFGGERGRRLLRYDRLQIAAGQWWRLLSGHLVHLDLRHAALNALGAMLMWALFARDYTGRQWLLILLASVAAIDLGFWLGDPGLEWYVGSSGVLHGVMAAGTLAHLSRREPDGWILLGFLVLKLFWEQGHGALPFNGSAAAVVVDAHLYGALGGALGALGARAMRARVESL